MLKHTWTDVAYSFNTGYRVQGQHTVEITFKDEQEAHQFVEALKIEKDVEEELKNYEEPMDEGVKRTVQRGKKRRGTRVS